MSQLNKLESSVFGQQGLSWAEALRLADYANMHPSDRTRVDVLLNSVAELPSILPLVAEPVVAKEVFFTPLSPATPAKLENPASEWSQDDIDSEFNGLVSAADLAESTEDMLVHLNIGSSV